MALTDKMEEETEKYFAEIERRGGVINCIEEGFFQRELAKSAYRFQQEIEKDERVIVGVNRYGMENEEIEIPVLKIDKDVEREQCAFVKKVRAERDNAAVKEKLEQLRAVAKGDGNTFEAILECVRVYGSLGEICDVLREEWGEHVESASAMQVS